MTSSPGNASRSSSQNGSPEIKKSTGTASTITFTIGGDGNGNDNDSNPDHLHLFGNTFAMANNFDWTYHGGGGVGMTYNSIRTPFHGKHWQQAQQACCSRLFLEVLLSIQCCPVKANQLPYLHQVCSTVTHQRMPSYMLEVLEFSFDWVTVDTNPSIESLWTLIKKIWIGLKGDKQHLLPGPAICFPQKSGYPWPHYLPPSVSLAFFGWLSLTWLTSCPSANLGRLSTFLVQSWSSVIDSSKITIYLNHFTGWKLI